MKVLVTERLLADPCVKEASRLFLQAVAEHQGQLTAICAPDPERKTAHEALIRGFNNAGGGNVYFPCLGAGFGHGSFVELAEGSAKIDLIREIGAHFFGHGHAAACSS